jgi:hypothetical protein
VGLPGNEQQIGTSPLLTYLLVYVPIRWVEWGIFEVVIHAGHAHGVDFSWRLHACAKLACWRSLLRL